MTGAFLIISLIFVLCCACQGQSIQRRRKDDYEYVERNSQNSLIKSGHSGSNDSSNTLDNPYRTTEESSLELSDITSRTSPHPPTQIAVIQENYYPPPPSLYDTEATTKPTKKPLSPVYASVNKNRDSVMSDDLPLPPPPPPQRLIHYEESDEEETCIKGLNPSFKTFLDKTIAVSPQPNHQLNQAHRNRNYPSLAMDAKQPGERMGLITSDL